MLLVEQLLDAALRLLRNNYRPWETSGGNREQECPHGILRYIACRRCDENLVKPYLTFEKPHPSICDVVENPLDHRQTGKSLYDARDRQSQPVPAPLGSHKP